MRVVSSTAATLAPRCLSSLRGQGHFICHHAGHLFSRGLFSTSNGRMSQPAEAATAAQPAAPTPERKAELAAHLELVRAKMNAAIASRGGELQRQVTLVAVSKFKPMSDIIALHELGHRHFGENYPQELVEKAQQLPSDIRWHFIGSLQSNKIKLIKEIPNLHMIETIENEKKAQAVNKAFEGRAPKLKVMIQVNTSGEENKSGVAPENLKHLATFIQRECPNLELAGLMTIGMAERPANAVNPDFECLVRCRKEVAEAVGVAATELELSMGMSADFEHAIEMGSTNIRVGSTIFGERERH